jgi:uncharacterized membrane protein YdjX (TVP38/TMEM64 family)
VASIIELVSILLTSLGMNLIPFASPSNLFIASNAALISQVDPISIGLLVAAGSAAAKSIHYVVTYFVGRHVGEERRKRLDSLAARFRHWEFLALFIAAATPIPDDPVIVSLGLMKYNPAKFLLAFFSGKLVVTMTGAYFGRVSEDLLSSMVSQEVLVATSIILTLIITVVLLKIDVEGIARRALKRITKEKSDCT